MLSFKHASAISPFRALGLSDFASEADVIREHKKLIQICQYDGRPGSDPVEIAKMLTKAKDEAVAICQKKQQEKEKAHAEFQQGLTEWEKHQKEIVEHVEELRPFTEPELTSKFISHDYLCKRLRAMASELLKNSKNYMRYDDSYISGYYNFVKHLKQAVRDREAEVSKLKEELERCRNETAGDLERGCAVADELAQGDDVSKVDQLIQERDAALSKVNELTHERDNALSRLNELTREKDSASSNIEELAREKEHSMREKTDALLRVSELTAERDAALSKVVEITSERDIALSKISERDAAVSKLVELTAEKDASELTAEREDARPEHDDAPSGVHKPICKRGRAEAKQHNEQSTGKNKAPAEMDDNDSTLSNPKRRKHRKFFLSADDASGFKQCLEAFLHQNIQISPDGSGFISKREIKNRFDSNWNENGNSEIIVDNIFFNELRLKMENAEYPETVFQKRQGNIVGYTGLVFK